MDKLDITDEYICIQVEHAGETYEARWNGGGYVRYFYQGEVFATAWQHDKVKDIKTLREFVEGNMTHHLAELDEAEGE